MFVVRTVFKKFIGRQVFAKNNNVHTGIRMNRTYSMLNHLHSKKNCLNIYRRNFHTSNYYFKIVSFNLSDIGEGIREVVIKEWFVKNGDKVSQFDEICEVQSDKASVTITSRYDGVIVKLYYEINDIALVGKPLVDINTEEDSGETTDEDSSVSSQKSTEPAAKLPTVQLEESSTALQTQNAIAIPSVRRIAKENKIQLSDVKGTGKDGRVLKEDIMAYINSRKTGKVTTVQQVKSEPVRGYTRTMIKTMTESMKIPHFLYCDEVAVTNMAKLREKLNKRLQKENIKISYMPFIIKAISNCLARYPIINSRLDSQCQHILYNESHNIGVAMDTPNGLAVPVIKNVQLLDIMGIASELNRLQALGKSDKFTQEDFSNGTFTISNIGSIGGTYAKPIILPNQSAIVALGSLKNVPRFDTEGNVCAEIIMNISASADHRLIDGATMAHFCNLFKEQMEEPYFLFLKV